MGLKFVLITTQIIRVITKIYTVYVRQISKHHAQNKELNTANLWQKQSLQSIFGLYVHIFLIEFDFK